MTHQGQLSNVEGRTALGISFTSLTRIFTQGVNWSSSVHCSPSSGTCGRIFSHSRQVWLRLVKECGPCTRARQGTSPRKASALPPLLEQSSRRDSHSVRNSHPRSSIMHRRDEGGLIGECTSSSTNSLHAPHGIYHALLQSLELDPQHLCGSAVIVSK